MFLKPKKIHIVGIGGSGNYYLALFLHYLGWQVSGSDISQNQRVEDLIRLGIRVFSGHQKENLLHSPELIVVSPAIPQDLPELESARKQKIPILNYPDFLDQIYSWLRKNHQKTAIKQALIKSNFAPFYHFDFGQTKIIGVTGTDGKTTTVSMIYHLAQKAGLKVGMISTVKAKIGQQEIDTGLHTTTPSAQQLAPIIKQMIDQKADWIVLEITSHGLAQHRVEGLKLAAAVYTNITEEHLDFHKTWSAYAQAKARMIDLLEPKGKIILNRDDRSFALLKKKAQEKSLSWLSYGQNKKSDLIISKIQTSSNKIKATLLFQQKEYQLTLPLVGTYNAFNAAAAILAGQQMGLKIKSSLKSLMTFPPVTGRMNILQRKPFTVIVDFAHTPNGLKQALTSAKKLVTPRGKLIVVFGAAGQRDSSKRPKMGQIAAQLAEILVLVPEDPRQEKTAQINQAIINGISGPKIVFSGNQPIKKQEIKLALKKGKKIIINFNQDRPQARREGLAWAINNAQSGDVVISCGKGHEKSLCFGSQEYPWDEIKIVKNLLKFN